jgi:ABC-type branched-subunit amino acid transport system substrate-binding protein
MIANNSPSRCSLLAAIGLAGGLLAPVAAGELTPEAERGIQLYRDGVAADGTRVTATLGQGSLTLSATKVPCASCHGPDGLGRPEAGVIPSNITWGNLTKPYGLRHGNGRSHPPYTADTIIAAVTLGVDPAGNTLDPAMPRYTLSDQSARDLLAHLKRLGTIAEPGVGEHEIIVAAIVPTAGPLAEVGAVVGSLLAGYFDRINRDGGIYDRKVVLKTAGLNASRSAVQALQGLLSEAEVFAVVAPFDLGQEGALAEFAQAAALPLVGPLAQFRRRASDRHGFTFHLTAGLEDQVRVLVKFAATNLAADDAKVAVVTSDDGAGLDIKDAIGRQNRNAKGAPALSWHLRASSRIADLVAQLQAAGVNVVFYDGGPMRLAALSEEAARSGWRPAILTTGLAATRVSLARMRTAAARVFIVYPLLGSDQSPEALQELHALQASYGIPGRHQPMQVPALVAGHILVEGLQRVGRDLTRSKFIAALAALQNFETGLMPPISFGPNRRTGVRGAHVMALRPGQDEAEHVWIELDEQSPAAVTR